MREISACTALPKVRRGQLAKRAKERSEVRGEGRGERGEGRGKREEALFPLFISFPFPFLDCLGLRVFESRW